jgi:hypothetical protein
VVRSTRTPWRYSRDLAARSVAFLPTMVLYQCTAPRRDKESWTMALTKASSPPADPWRRVEGRQNVGIKQWPDAFRAGHWVREASTLRA